jgi:dTMP kinase
MRGKFILFEGCDHSGKTTQSKKLVKSLMELNIKTEYFCFPIRNTIIGNLIKQYLEKKIDFSPQVIHLLFSANRWEKKEEMEKLLNEGVNLVVDRYSFSGIVYSSIKENMEMDWCKNTEKGLLIPDMVIFCKSKPNNTRQGYGNERYEEDDIQQKILNYFNYFAKKGNWLFVENGSIEELHEKILSKVKKWIN